MDKLSWFRAQVLMSLPVPWFVLNFSIDQNLRRFDYYCALLQQSIQSPLRKVNSYEIYQTFINVTWQSTIKIYVKMCDHFLFSWTIVR